MEIDKKYVKFRNIHKHVKFQEYTFKSIVLMLFSYKTYDDIRFTALDKEFQRFINHDNLIFDSDTIICRSHNIRTRCNDKKTSSKWMEAYH